jgi:hypothetical protein
MGEVIGVLDDPLVARMTAVIKDHFLIEIPQIVAHCLLPSSAGRARRALGLRANHGCLRAVGRRQRAAALAADCPSMDALRRASFLTI